MNCFPCFQSQRSRKSTGKREQLSPSSKDLIEQEVPAETSKKQKGGKEAEPETTQQVETGNIKAQSFTFRELATATKNFRQECLLGEGVFGRVFKGTLGPGFSGQVVAIKQLDRNGMKGNKEFLGEVLILSLLHHPNLVNLIGYCADGDQRLLVHEFMSGGSVEDRLFDITSEQKALDWFTRMRIAFGIAKGLEYLHEKANPPVVYRDLKPSNILLDNDFTPKLSDFGFANFGPSAASGDNKMPISSRVMGTYGYCAPEYARSNELTTKSDVYSFGVILLELITGRKAIDTTKPIQEQNLVSWAQPLFRNPKNYPDMADPLLYKKFPEKDLNQAVALVAMCLQQESAARPLMSDVVTALSFLSEEKIINHNQQHNEGECHTSDNEDAEGEIEEEDDDDDEEEEEEEEEDNDDEEEEEGWDKEKINEENHGKKDRGIEDIDGHISDVEGEARDGIIDNDDKSSVDDNGDDDEEEDGSTNVDKGSVEDKHQQKYYGKSSMKSFDESHHKSRKRLTDKTRHHNNYSGSSDDIDIDRSSSSSRKSHDPNAYLVNRNSSKTIMLSSLSRMSSRGSREGSSSTSSRKSLSHQSSMGSQHGNDDEVGSLRYSSSRRSEIENFLYVTAVKDHMTEL